MKSGMLTVLRDPCKDLQIYRWALSHPLRNGSQSQICFLFLGMKHLFPFQKSFYMLYTHLSHFIQRNLGLEKNHHKDHCQSCSLAKDPLTLSSTDGWCSVSGSWFDTSIQSMYRYDIFRVLRCTFFSHLSSLKLKHFSSLICQSLNWK